MPMQKQSMNPALKKQQSKNSLTYDLTLKSLSKKDRPTLRNYIPKTYDMTIEIKPC